MKFFIKNIAGALLVVAFLIAGGATISNAQEKTAKTFKTILSNIARAKKSNGGFTLVTPGELAAAGDLPNAGDPCDTAAAIDIGQTVGNALNSTDCRLDDGSYADFYVFNGTQGQQVTIQMDSSSIDSYLGLANESGSFVVEDDDSGGGLSARILATLPETGMYAILANSVSPNEFGGYTLTLNGASRCAFSVSPTTQTVAAAGGTYSFNITTQPECYWRASTNNNYTTVSNPTGRGGATVSYTVAQNGTGSTRTSGVTVSTAPLESATIATVTFTQPSVACAFSLSPASVNLSASAQNSSFLIVAPSGCSWSASATYWTTITNNASGSGSGQVGFFIRYNNGAPRTDYINITDHTNNRVLTFLVNQDGLNCNFTITPQTQKIGRQGGTRTVNINAQSGCQWSALSNSTFIHLINSTGSGAGAVSFRVDAQTEQQDRSGAIQFDFQTNAPFSSAFIDQSKNSLFTASDFDGDGKADVSVFRPSDGVWYLNRSRDGYAGYQFGVSTDKLVPADYDGDGKTDVAVYRDGNWFVLKSSNLSFASYNFGLANDIPAPADFDGDGRAELAVFRPSDATWYRFNLANNAFSSVGFGQSGDTPVAADYDGDGKADVAVYRPSDGVWYLQRSRDGFVGYQFGVSTDKPVPGDYDGDGKTDVAVYRASAGSWFVLRSSNLSFASTQFGLSSDIPAPADFDGDGKTDFAVFRPDVGSWYQLKSSEGFGAVSFGKSGDKPTQTAFIR